MFMDTKISRIWVPGRLLRGQALYLMMVNPLCHIKKPTKQTVCSMV